MDDGNDKHLGPNGSKFKVNDLLASLMSSYSSTTEDHDHREGAEELENLNPAQLDGEYSALNNTIDELNRFLDVWDTRHDNLRSEIREALQETADDVETESETPSEDAAEDSATDKQSTESTSETKSN